MNRPNPWDVSASGPPVASGQVPFFNPAQFQPNHSTGSAVAPSAAFNDAGQAALMDEMPASYQYEQTWPGNWNNLGAWSQPQPYSSGYAGDYYQQQLQSGEPPVVLPEGDMGTFHDQLVYDPNWLAHQSYEHYPAPHYADTGEYNSDPAVVGGYDTGATVSSSHGTVSLYASNAFDGSSGMSPFFHPADEVSSSGLQSLMAPHNAATKVLEEFSGEKLPAVSSFNNISHQPSPFDELGDIRSPARTGMLEQSVVLSSHSRHNSAGGGVQFLIGGSTSVSETPSRTDSPHMLGLEAGCDSAECGPEDKEIGAVITEHAVVTQPHFTDAGSHKNLSVRTDEPPVHLLPPPQGTMTGTPASGHQRKPASSFAASLEHMHVPPGYGAPVSSEAVVAQAFASSTNTQVVHPGAGIFDEPGGHHRKPASSFAAPQEYRHIPPDYVAPVSPETAVAQAFASSTNTQAVHPGADISEEPSSMPDTADDHRASLTAEHGNERHTDMYAGPLGLHSGSPFTPVGSALTMNVAVAPGQQLSSSRSTATSHMQTGSVCSAARSDTGKLDMQEIELDAMVDSGSPQEAACRAEAGSSMEAVGEHRVGSGTSKQKNVHDSSTHGHVHHHMKSHREATMSPAATLWENPEPASIQLMPASAAVVESRRTTELPQNTDAGPNTSGTSGTYVHELNVDVQCANDQQVPQTPVASSVMPQTSHATSVDHSVPSKLVFESSTSRQPVVQSAADADTASVMASESVDSISEEIARSNITPVSRYGHASNSFPPKSVHGVLLPSVPSKTLCQEVPETPEKLAGEDVGKKDDVLPRRQLSDLKPSVAGDVDQFCGMEARHLLDIREQNVRHAAEHNRQSSHNNSQQNFYETINKTPSVPPKESGVVPVQFLPQQRMHDDQKVRQNHDDASHALKSQHQRASRSGSPDEQHRATRYRGEVEKPLSRQDDIDHLNRRPLSRHDDRAYDERAYDRPHSRQDYDQSYSRSHDRPGYDYGYEQPRPTQDQYGRPSSRQRYEDPHYRPRSRQGYDDQRYVPVPGESYAGSGRQQRPEYDGRHERPSSRQSYHEPVERSSSQQDYDRRPRSRQDYEDWSAHSNRDREAAGSHYHRNRHGDPDSYARPGSNQEFMEERRDPYNAPRYPDESFNRRRYGASDEGYDRRYYPDSGDSRNQASQSYREEEQRRSRSRGGDCCFFASNFLKPFSVLTTLALLLCFVYHLISELFIIFDKHCTRGNQEPNKFY